MEQYNGDVGRANCAMRSSSVRSPEGCDYETLDNQRNEASVGEIINKALEKIEDENKQKLAGVFHNIDFNSESALGRTKQRNDRLKNPLEDCVGSPPSKSPS